MKTNQKKLTLLFPLILLIIITLWFGGLSSYASGGLGFAVRPQHPENQRLDSNSYFDLITTPGQSQTLEVEIENLTDASIQMEIEVNNAYTNTAGGVDYQQHGIKDESLIYSIEDLVTLTEKVVDLKPKETKTIKLDLKMPEESLNGVVLGGIVFTRTPDETTVEEEENITISNIFSFVSGLQIRQSEQEVDIELALVDTMATARNYRSALVNSIRNSSPALLSDASMTISVYHQGDAEPTWVYTQDTLKMAPNSLMEHIIYIEEAHIAPGLYRSHIEIKGQNQEWAFDSEFNIPASDAKKLENHGVDTPTILEGPLKAVLIIIVILLVGMLIVVAYLLIKTIKSRKDQ